MEGGVVPRDGVLGVGAVRSHHLMKGGNTVTGLELGHVAADLVDDTGHIVTLVVLISHPDGDLPILGIRPTNDHLDQDLVGVGLRNRHVLDPHLRSYGVEKVSQF